MIIESIKNKILSIRIYIFLFLITLIILLIKYPNLWLSPTPLPGWDDIGHYYAFLKQIELFKLGYLKGYMLDWFGGMPLFYFYSPLFFWIAGLFSILFPFIYTTLIFKWLILLSLSFFTPVFYYFSKVFLPIKPNVFIALSISFLYIFFQPYEFGNLGIGLSGAITAGLINQGPGIILSLLFLAFYKQFLESEIKIFSDKYFYFAIISGSLLVYTHTLSLFFAVILGIIVFLFYVKRKLVLLKSVLVLFGIFFISAYFLLPLLSYYQYSSGWGYRRSEGAFIDPLQPLLAFDLLDLYYGRFFIFNWPWFVVVLGSIGGFISLIKKKFYLLPTLFLIPFLVIPRNYLPEMFQGLSVQFYRIMPILIILFMTISLYGLSLFWVEIKENKKYSNYKLILLIIFILLIVWRISSFSFNIDQYNVKPNLIRSTENPFQYYQEFSQYPDKISIDSLMNCFKNLPKGQGRIAVDSDFHLMLQQFGSAHYLNYSLPMAGYPVLQGLYTESANQSAFIFPSFSNISSSMINDGYPNSNYLLWNNIYRSRSILDSLKQISLFNVQYFLAYHYDSKYVMNSIDKSLVDKISCSDTNFEIYKINESIRRPYVSNTTFKPMLYIKENNNYLSFRKLSLGWYTSTNLFDVPIIYKDGLKIDSISSSFKDLNNISAIIVGSETLNEEQINILEKTGKPILVLSDKQYNGITLPNNFSLIDKFKPVADFDEYNQSYFPNSYSLSNLQSFVDNKIRFDFNKINNSLPVVYNWSDTKISFSSYGPTIINVSYFPAWKSDNINQEVYEVTPGQMLIFGNGNNLLNFKSTNMDVVGGFISLSSIFILIFFMIKNKNK